MDTGEAQVPTYISDETQAEMAATTGGMQYVAALIPWGINYLTFDDMQEGAMNSEEIKQYYNAKALAGSSGDTDTKKIPLFTPYEKAAKGGLMQYAQFVESTTVDGKSTKNDNSLHRIVTMGHTDIILLEAFCAATDIKVSTDRNDDKATMRFKPYSTLEKELLESVGEVMLLSMGKGAASFGVIVRGVPATNIEAVMEVAAATVGALGLLGATHLASVRPQQRKDKDGAYVQSGYTGNILLYAKGEAPDFVPMQISYNVKIGNEMRKQTAYTGLGNLVVIDHDVCRVCGGVDRHLNGCSKVYEDRREMEKHTRSAQNEAQKRECDEVRARPHAPLPPPTTIALTDRPRACCTGDQHLPAVRERPRPEARAVPEDDLHGLQEAAGRHGVQEDQLQVHAMRSPAHDAEEGAPPDHPQALGDKPEEEGRRGAARRRDDKSAGLDKGMERGGAWGSKNGAIVIKQEVLMTKIATNIQRDETHNRNFTRRRTGHDIDPSPDPTTGLARRRTGHDIDPSRPDPTPEQREMTGRMDDLAVAGETGTKPWRECFDWKKTGDDTGPAEPWARGMCDAWGIESLRRECGNEAIMCMGRATWAVRTWEARRKDRKSPVPKQLLRRLLHTPGRDALLPTSVSKAADQYYMPYQHRFATAGEVADTMGIKGRNRGKELRAALDGGTPGVSQQAARGMIGGALHVGMTTAVVAEGLRAMGSGAGKQLTFMDVCSGVGTMAVAVSKASGRTVRYVEAAEKKKAARAVLRAVWGDGLTIHKDATGAEMMGSEAKQVDVAAITAPCGVWSKLNASRGKKKARTEAKKLWRTIVKRVAERKPRMIIVESVAALMGRDEEAGRELEEIMQEATEGYVWRRAVLGAHTHGGDVTVRRDRAYWVALKDGWGGTAQSTNK